MSTLCYAEAAVTRVSDTVERRFIQTEQLMTVIVDFSGGPAPQPDPYHSHPHEQTSYVAEGEVIFLIEGEAPVHLKAGDLAAISANKKHAIQLLTPTARLIDSFTPIRADFL